MPPRSALLAFAPLALLHFSLVACGGDVSHSLTQPAAADEPAVDAGPDASTSSPIAVTDGGSDAASEADAGRCCPPSSSPACCMAFGGYDDGNGCLTVCDSIPNALHLASDAHGCPYWSAAGSTGNVCGVPEYGLEAGTGAGTEAGAEGG